MKSLPTITLMLVTLLSFLSAGALTPSPTAGKLTLRPHPRLLADAETFRSIKARMTTEKPLDWGAKRVKFICDREYLNSPMPKYGVTDGRRMLATSWYVHDRVTMLAMAYRLFGDERYLRKAEEFMLAAAAMPDWNPKHFLDVAVMAFGVAIGYDWLYDDLRPEARAQIRLGLERNAVDAGMANRLLVAPIHSNWSQVGPGGVMAAALAIAEEAPQKCETLRRRIVEGMPKVMSMYAPNGGYPEGSGYWRFGTMFNVILVASLESAYGTAFGLCEQPGFRETGAFQDFVNGPTGMRANFSDCSTVREPAWMVWWFARRFNEPSLVEPFERGAYGLDDCRSNSPFFLLYLFPRPAEVKVDLPLAWQSGGGVHIAVQRSSWEKDGRFAALKGGKATDSHGHMDGGSFIYEDKGVRWAWDIGSAGYENIEAHIGMGLWRYAEGSPRYRLFRLSAFSHNTLILDNLAHSATGEVKVIAFTPGAESKVTMDLSPLFTNATEVLRVGKMRADGYQLADRVRGLRQGAPIRWQMMTRAAVRQEGEDLQLDYEGKSLRLHRQGVPEGTPWKIEEAPNGEAWEPSNAGFRRLSFEVPSNPKETKFSVTFK